MKRLLFILLLLAGPVQAQHFVGTIYPALQSPGTYYNIGADSSMAMDFHFPVKNGKYLYSGYIEVAA